MMRGHLSFHAAFMSSFFWGGGVSDPQHGGVKGCRSTERHIDSDEGAVVLKPKSVCTMRGCKSIRELPAGRYVDKTVSSTEELFKSSNHVRFRMKYVVFQ